MRNKQDMESLITTIRESVYVAIQPHNHFAPRSVVQVGAMEHSLVVCNSGVRPVHFNKEAAVRSDESLKLNSMCACLYPE